MFEIPTRLNTFSVLQSHHSRHLHNTSGCFAFKQGFTGKDNNSGCKLLELLKDMNSNQTCKNSIIHVTNDVHGYQPVTDPLDATESYLRLRRRTECSASFEINAPMQTLLQIIFKYTQLHELSDLTVCSRSCGLCRNKHQ